MSSFVPNPGQKTAIAAPFDQPVRVVAGAGTGKTEVIARRYLHLLQAGRLRPENILVLTFSEKAAAEMRARIARAVAGPGIERLDLADAPISTFHSFCAHLLAEHSLAARVDPGLSLLTEIDAQELLDLAQEAFLAGGYQQAYGDFNPLDSSNYSWEDGGPFAPALVVINQLRNQGIGWDEFEREAAVTSTSEGQRVLAPLVAWLYRAYLDGLAGRGQLDFDRLIMDAAALLERDDSLRLALAEQYQAVLVDEYQDTNFAQERLLRALARRGMHNVTVVGDPRQAIYIWREARVENIAGFPGGGGRRFEAPLVENRRSLTPILSVASRAIAGYEFGQPEEFDAADELAPSREHEAFEGVVVSLEAQPDREAEARAVVRWIERLRADGFPYRDIALLLRARTYLPMYLAALEAAGIPVEVSASDAFFTRPEILDAIHLLRICLDPADDLSLARVLLSPAAGLNQAQVAGLRVPNQRCLWQAVLAPPEAGLDATARASLARLVALRRDAQVERWRLSPAAFLGWTVRRSGLGAAPDPAAQRALRKLLAIAHGFEADHPAQGLVELAEFLRLTLDGDPRAKAPEINSQADAVQVMTAHASKGLEFAAVIAADCREKVKGARKMAPFHEPQAGLIFPADDKDAPQYVERTRRARNEDRCLWYVTLTRAKRRLIITATNDAERVDGRYPKVETFFEELWNQEAADPSPGVELVQDTMGEPAPASRANPPAATPSPPGQDLLAAQALQARLQARFMPSTLPLPLDWSADWEGAAELADPAYAPVLTASRAGGRLPPIVGYELANPVGRVIGQAELAWEAQRLAVFLDAEDPSRDAFARAGWRTFLAGEVEAIQVALNGPA
jgi:DNA helicase-2/ATP-dependent DNA helicase PcrA